MTLTIEPTLIDKAIASYTNLLELQIKDGKVTQIKKVKPPPPSPPTDIDLIITGKPKSLHDKLQTSFYGGLKKTFILRRSQKYA
jgi:hypothetical protein